MTTAEAKWLIRDSHLGGWEGERPDHMGGRRKVENRKYILIFLVIGPSSRELNSDDLIFWEFFLALQEAQILPKKNYTQIFQRHPVGEVK